MKIKEPQKLKLRQRYLIVNKIDEGETNMQWQTRKQAQQLENCLLSYGDLRNDVITLCVVCN